jgi:hypothetical protein
MKKFNGNTIVERNQAEFISSQLGDDIVLMNTNNSNYFGMNAPGADIWHLLDAPLRQMKLLPKLLICMKLMSSAVKKTQ